MCERPCQRCPSSPFHKSASCHDGVAFIIRLWFLQGLAPEQLGSIGCHSQPPAAVKDGRAGDGCCPPCLRCKAPLKPQGIWAHGASSTSKRCLRKQLAVRSWYRKWSWNDKYNRVCVCVCEREFTRLRTATLGYNLCLIFIVRAINYRYGTWRHCYNNKI